MEYKIESILLVFWVVLYLYPEYLQKHTYCFWVSLVSLALVPVIALSLGEIFPCVVLLLVYLHYSYRANETMHEEYSDGYNREKSVSKYKQDLRKIRRPPLWSLFLPKKC